MAIRDGMSNRRAPSHKKPPMPRMTDIAARLAAGEPLTVIAAQYERTPATFRTRLNSAGFNSIDGKPVATKPPVRPVVLPFFSQAWADDALCAQIDPSLFVPERTGADARPAKAICGRCTVSVECLNYAMGIGEFRGVYGGTTGGERSKLKRAAS